MTGDAKLEVLLRASDRYDDSGLVFAQREGDFTAEAGVRLPMDSEVVASPIPGEGEEPIPEVSITPLPLSSAVTVRPGESFIVETRVTQGKNPVPIPYPSTSFRVDPSSTVSFTSEEIAPGKIRITIGDQAGTLSGVISAINNKPDLGSATSKVLIAPLVAKTRFTVDVQNSPAPEGEFVDATNQQASAGGGLLNNSQTVAAVNQLNVPLAAVSDDSELGTSFGLDSIQLPFGSPDNLVDFGRGLESWFSNSFDLLNVVDLESIMEWFGGGLPVTPEDIIRVKLDLEGLSTALPPTAFAADFSGLLPDGFTGEVDLDSPQLTGQIVFGIDTSNSPFYVLTQPDELQSNFTSVDDVLAGGAEQSQLVGQQVTEIGASLESRPASVAKT